MTKEEFDKKVKWTKIFGIILGILLCILLRVFYLILGSNFKSSIWILFKIIEFIICYGLFYLLTKKEKIAGPIIGIIFGVVYFVRSLGLALITSSWFPMAVSLTEHEILLDFLLLLLFILVPIIRVLVVIFVVVNSISMLKYINQKTKVLKSENIDIDSKKDENINLDLKNGEYETKNKKHTGRKILIILALIILFTILLIFGYSKYEESHISWDTGNVEITGKEIHLPCKISDFEYKFGTKINNTSYESPFIDFYLSNDNAYINYNISIKSGKKIQLYIEDDFITGIEVDISNMYNDYLDYSLGELVIFPQNITANSDIDEIHEAYKTGFLNLFMRDDTETRYGGDYSFKYGDEKYSIDIETDGKHVKSIFYYYCGKI